MSMSTAVDGMAGYQSRIAAEHGENYLGDSDLDPPSADALDRPVFDTAPPARRLIELLKIRGWAGWTELGRVEPGSDPTGKR